VISVIAFESEGVKWIIVLGFFCQSIWFVFLARWFLAYVEDERHVFSYLLLF